MRERVGRESVKERERRGERVREREWGESERERGTASGVRGRERVVRKSEKMGVGERREGRLGRGLRW